MNMLRVGLSACLYLVFAAQAAEPQPLQATKSLGDTVILEPNGRWHFVDHDKATAAEKIAR